MAMDSLWPNGQDKVGEFKLESRLGSGGMGEVFLGRSAEGRPVAVKFIRAEYADDPNYRRRFAREVEAARKVAGRYTAKVVDADAGADPPWMATAYIDGPTLANAVADNGPFDPANVRRLGAELAEGLKEIHAHGLVHRDLKPTNVIMPWDESGARIIDFGVARVLDASGLTRAGMPVGTEAYMSPEQLRGEQVGPASDVYALGAVLAFAAGSSRSSAAGPDLSRLDSELAGLISRCLADNPAGRPTPDQLMTEFARSSARTAPDPPPGDRDTRADSARWMDRLRARPRLAAVMALVVLLVLLLPAGWLLHSSVSHSAGHPGSADPASRCQASLGGRRGKEPVGFVSSSCMSGKGLLDLRDVMQRIEEENKPLEMRPGGGPTVVFFGVLTDETATVSNPSSVQQLYGVALAQKQYNATVALASKLRITFVNAADGFVSGPQATEQITTEARAHPGLLAVVGIGQSRQQSLDAVRRLGRSGAGLAIVATSVTGEKMMDNTPGFYRVSPGNERQAEAAASFARYGALNATDAFILQGSDSADLYSQDLAHRFLNAFTRLGGGFAGSCNYEERDGTGDCGSGKVDAEQVATTICDRKPGVIFYASRAVQLKKLLQALSRHCAQPVSVLGSSDVPKYITSDDVKATGNKVQLYYVTFSAAKVGGCPTPPQLFQTPAQCAFLEAFLGNNPSSPDNNPFVAFSVNDAMLGYDALNTLKLAIQKAAAQGPLTQGAVAQALADGISFDAASGNITLASQQQTSPDKPIFIVKLETTQTLTIKMSCGQFSSSAVRHTWGDNRPCPS